VRTVDIRHVKIAEHKVEGPVLDKLDSLATTLDHLHLCAAHRELVVSIPRTR
jgi:hypothetical protein